MPPFGFLTFPYYCVRGPRTPMSLVDIFGVATGSDYRHSKVHTPKPGSYTHGGIGDLRGGFLICHGYKARDVALHIVTSPFVRDVRSYVPWWIPEWGPRKDRRSYIVLERVVAVELQFRPGEYHFHVITTDHPLNERALSQLATLGVTAEHLLPERFTAIQLENAEQCFGALNMEGLDLYSLDALASETADRLYRSRTQGTLEDKLKVILTKIPTSASDPLLGVDIDDLYIYCYAATMLGHLVPDPRYRFRRREVVHLVHRRKHVL